MLEEPLHRVNHSLPGDADATSPAASDLRASELPAGQVLLGQLPAHEVDLARWGVLHVPATPPRQRGGFACRYIVDLELASEAGRARARALPSHAVAAEPAPEGFPVWVICTRSATATAAALDEATAEPPAMLLLGQRVRALLSETLVEAAAEWEQDLAWTRLLQLPMALSGCPMAAFADFDDGPPMATSLAHGVLAEVLAKCPHQPLADLEPDELLDSAAGLSGRLYGDVDVRPGRQVWRRALQRLLAAHTHADGRVAFARGEADERAVILLPSVDATTAVVLSWRGPLTEYAEPYVVTEDLSGDLEVLRAEVVCRHRGAAAAVAQLSGARAAEPSAASLHEVTADAQLIALCLRELVTSFERDYAAGGAQPSTDDSRPAEPAVESCLLEPPAAMPALMPPPARTPAWLSLVPCAAGPALALAEAEEENQQGACVVS